MANSILRFSNANSLRMVVTTLPGLSTLDRDFQFFKDFSLPVFDSFFQPILNTDKLTIQFDSDFEEDQLVSIRDYYTGAFILPQDDAVLVANRVDYNIYEFTIDPFDMAGYSGVFYYEVVCNGNPSIFGIARSEPFTVKAEQCNTVLLKYSNNDNAFGIDYETASTNFEFRIPAFFNRTADESETETFKDSGGNTSIVSSKGTRARVLKLNQLVPQWVIEKINIILLHDNVTIDGVAVSADKQMPYEPISDKALWSEPEVSIILASGSSDYINSHKI